MPKKLINMSEYKVKNKKNGFVYIVRAHDKAHAINKAIERTNYLNAYNDFTVIK